MAGDVRRFLCNGAQRLEPEWASAQRLDHTGPGAVINLRNAAFGQLLNTDLPARFLDLVEIAAFVYAADCMVKRGGAQDKGVGKDWRRDLRFSIGVREPAFWRQDEVTCALGDLLAFLSEDFCTFEFAPLSKDRPRNFQGALFETETPGARDIVLFSGGLDSTAGVLERVNSGRPLRLVSHVSNPATGAAQKKVFSELRNKFPNAVMDHHTFHLNLSSDVTKEVTHRSRSFLFVALAAAVARFEGANEILFFENGVISLNLRLAGAISGARATRSTHPQTLAHFGRLLSLVDERPMSVTNTFFSRTKTEVVQSIAALNGADLIEHTRSCAHVHARSGKHPHCGWCTQCVDRRFAMLASGLEAHDAPEGYASQLPAGEWASGANVRIADYYLSAAHAFSEISIEDLFLQHGELNRALPFIGRSPQEAARLIHDLHSRHGQAVMRALDSELRRYSDDLVRHRLPAYCLLRRWFGTGDAIPDQDEKQADEGRQNRYYHLRFFKRSTGKVACRIDELAAFGHAVSELLACLAESFRKARNEGRAPAGFPFMSNAKIGEGLKIEDDALRRRVANFHKAFNRALVDQGRPPAKRDSVIESRDRQGRRLNPFSVVVVDTPDEPEQPRET